ncbi:MAG: hypothetical protein Tsb009_37070 [Planctomycetaceae bacterium]
MGENSDEKLDRIVEALQQVNVNLESLRVNLQTLDQLTIDHEKRIRSVEQWKHNITPILAALTFTLGAVFSVTLQRIF